MQQHKCARWCKCVIWKQSEGGQEERIVLLGNCLLQPMVVNLNKTLVWHFLPKEPLQSLKEGYQSCKLGRIDQVDWMFCFLYWVYQSWMGEIYNCVSTRSGPSGQHNLPEIYHSGFYSNHSNLEGNVC